MNILLVFTLVILSVLIHPDLHQTDAALLKQHEFGANAGLIGIDKSPSAKGFTDLCAYSNARQTSDSSSDLDTYRVDITTLSDEDDVTCIKEFKANYDTCSGKTTMTRKSGSVCTISQMSCGNDGAEQEICYLDNKSGATITYWFKYNGVIDCSGTTNGKQSSSPSTVTLGPYSLRQKVLRVGQAMYKLCDLNGCTDLVLGKSLTSAQSVEAHSNLKKSPRENEYPYWYNYTFASGTTTSCHQMSQKDGSGFGGNQAISCGGDSCGSQLLFNNEYSMIYDSMTMTKDNGSPMNIALGMYCSNVTMGRVYTGVCGGGSTKEDAHSDNQVNLGPFTLKRTLDQGMNQYQLCDFTGCKDL